MKLPSCASKLHDEGNVSLDELAALSGVDTEYVNTFGEVVRADPSALEAVLRARSAIFPGESPSAALDRRRDEIRSEWLPPVLLARAGDAVLASLPADLGSDQWLLEDEEGSELARGTGRAEDPESP
jgi:hypothetical protein